MKTLKEAKARFLANLISRKALCFFIGIIGTSILILYGLVVGKAIRDIAMLVGSWTASVSAFASIWCVANHFDKRHH